MYAEGWKQLVKDAVEESSNGNPEKLDLLARYLEMCDLAKQELRNRGYGWTGVDILETVRLVPNISVGIVDERSDNSEPGIQISGLTADGDILEPCND